MKNFVQPGETITLTAPYALNPGDGCLVGTIFGVSCGTYANGAVDAEVYVDDSVFDITALTTDVIAQGAAVYWDNANKRITSSAAGNTKVGVVTVAKANGDTTARVRLNGTF